MRIELEPAEVALVEQDGLRRGVPPATLPLFVRSWQEEFGRRVLSGAASDGADADAHSSVSTTLLLAILAHEVGHLNTLASQMGAIVSRPGDRISPRARGLMKGTGDSVDAFLQEKHRQIAAGLE